MTNVLRGIDSDGMRRLAPPIAALLIASAAFWLFVQPRLSELVWLRAEVRALENRATAIRGLADRNARLGANDYGDPNREFAERMPAGGRAPEVVEYMARLALDPRAPGELRGLAIEAGERLEIDTAMAPASPLESTRRGGVDPRFRLFDARLEYVPVTVAFEATADRAGDLLWHMRELPTIVDVQSMEISGGASVLKVELTLLALHRVPGERRGPRADASDFASARAIDGVVASRSDRLRGGQ
jgi:hypothetical protein